MREAMLYDTLKHRAVRCRLCFRRCLITAGNRGFCGVRENRDGTLYALNYPLAISAAIDPIEKKPLNRFMPGTRTYSFAAAGCNLRCPWCQNAAIAWVDENAPVKGTHITPEDHIKAALRHGCHSVACTYTEPTVYVEYALETMQRAREAGLKTVWVTNGAMSPEALAMILPWLDAANVDYKVPGSRHVARFSLAPGDPVVKTIDTMVKAGVHVEVTTLVVPGVNDDEATLREMVETMVSTWGTEVPWHVSRFFPSALMREAKPTPLATLTMVQRFGEQAGLKHVYLGNVW